MKKLFTTTAQTLIARALPFQRFTEPAKRGALQPASDEKALRLTIARQLFGGAQ